MTQEERFEKWTFAQMEFITLRDAWRAALEPARTKRRFSKTRIRRSCYEKLLDTHVIFCLIEVMIDCGSYLTNKNSHIIPIHSRT